MNVIGNIKCESPPNAPWYWKIQASLGLYLMAWGYKLLPPDSPVTITLREKSRKRD